MGFYLNKTCLFKMYQTFYIVLFLAVYSSASPAMVILGVVEDEPISVDAAIEEPPENPANSSYVDLSKKHHDKKDHKKSKHYKFSKMRRKFHEAKHPCVMHWIHLIDNEEDWELECTKDGFYSVEKKVCWESKCWCVDRMGRYVKRAPKNPKKT